MVSKLKTSVLVCDELFFTLTGKQLAQGIYTTDDIAIPSSEHRAPQLVFIFSIECPLDDFMSSATFKIELPDTPPHVHTVPVAPPNPMMVAANPARKVWSFMHPVLVQQPLLKPGVIKTTLITEHEEVDCGTIWITSLATLAPAATRLS
jgi:hypothetical protein